MNRGSSALFSNLAFTPYLRCNRCGSGLELKAGAVLIRPCLHTLCSQCSDAEAVSADPVCGACSQWAGMRATRKTSWKVAIDPKPTPWCPEVLLPRALAARLCGISAVQAQRLTVTARGAPKDTGPDPKHGFFPTKAPDRYPYSALQFFEPGLYVGRVCVESQRRTTRNLKTPLLPAVEILWDRVLGAVCSAVH
jgi:hypothetical protein